MIFLDRVTKCYRRGRSEVFALADVCLEVAEGEFVCLAGPSGSGKSTLLHILAGLDRPTSGIVRILGMDLAEMGDAALSDFRGGSIGFGFQAFHLLGYLSAIENVLLPLTFQGRPAHEGRARSRALLVEMGLGDRLDHRPDDLSVGEMQRVALARALAAGPALLLLDEPTSNLDEEAAASVMAILGRVQRERGLTTILATHDPRVAQAASRRVEIYKGRIRGCDAA